MSWQEKRVQPFTITTGDGVVYTPLWDSQRSVVLLQEFNIAEFRFKALKGTLVDRGEVMGNIYDIEVVFQGADHLTDAANFRNSAKNKKAWTINHPYYGIFICHPSRLKYVNDEGNITRIVGQVLETIDATTVSTSINQLDKIAIDKLNVDTAFYSRYIADIPAPKVVDIQGMTANIKEVDNKYAPLIKLSDDFNAFKNGVNTANSFIGQATEFPGNAIASIQSVISAPANFIDSEVHRLAMLESAFVGFYRFAINLPNTLKILYENNAGTAISTMCLASVTNITTDYNYRPDVVSVIQTILNNYNSYLENLDTLSTDNGGEVDSYIADGNSLNLLTSLVNYTVSQLLIIAANAKQQNILVLPENDNVTTLAYTLYSATNDDTVDRLIADNNINYSELLLIRKGREIIYYT